MKILIRFLAVSFICLNLSGCLTMMALNKLNETEYTPTQISHMSNYGLIQCKKGNVTSDTQNACIDEIQARLKTGKMTDAQYSAYESGVDQADASSSQAMAEYMQRQRAIDNQKAQSAQDAWQSNQPIDVNVHHEY